MASDDRNTQFENLTVTDSLTDPGGSTHTGTLGSGDGGPASASATSVGAAGTDSGDDSTREFTLDHPLGEIPTAISVDARTDDASTDFFISGATATDVTIEYAAPPPAGTDNLSWYVTATAADALTTTTFSDDDGTTLSDITDLQFGANLDLVDDGDGTGTVNATTDGGGGTSYTDEQAQDAVGGILSSDFTYGDSSNTITMSPHKADASAHHTKYTDENAQDAVGAALGPGLTYDDGSNTIDQNVVANGTATLAGGTATVSTGVSTTGTHIDVALDPSGNGANNANVKVAARAFWDNGANEYKIEILEDGTSVGNPAVGYEITAR